MSPPPLAQLAAALNRARANYRAGWQTADEELYDLCRRRPSQRDYPEVYAKVAVIGRVYQAGISRSSRAEGDRESAVAHGLMPLAGVLDSGLANLVGCQFDLTTALAVIRLHAEVTKGLLPYTGDRWLQSFVSKYLHFHSPLVPIYDSLAEAAIPDFVDASAVAHVRATCLQQTPGAPAAYRNFVAAFVVLDKAIGAATGQQASVKEIDHLLWSGLTGSTADA